MTECERVPVVWEEDPEVEVAAARPEMTLAEARSAFKDMESEFVFVFREMEVSRPQEELLTVRELSPRVRLRRCGLRLKAMAKIRALSPKEAMGIVEKRAESSLEEESRSESCGGRGTEGEILVRKNGDGPKTRKFGFQEAHDPLDFQWNSLVEATFLRDLERSIHDEDPTRKAKIIVMDQEGVFKECQSSVELQEILDEFRELQVKWTSADFSSAGRTSIQRPVMWIDVEGANSSEIEKIGRMLRVHPLTIEDCLLSTSRQKLEPFEEYIVVILSSLHHVVFEPEHENPIKMLIFPNLVITFRRYPLLSILMSRARLSKGQPSQKNLQSLGIAHTIIDSLADSDVPVVDAIDQEVEVIDDLIHLLGPLDLTELLQKIGIARRKIVRLRQLLWPKRDVLMTFVQKEDLTVNLHHQLNVAYFRDVYDHLVSMIQKLDVASELLTSLQSTFLSKVSLEMAESSNQANVVSQTFSSIATMVLPLSFIAGAFGMNVRVPWNFSTSLVPFSLLLLAMLAAAILLLLWFRQKRWV